MPSKHVFFLLPQDALRELLSLRQEAEELRRELRSASGALGGEWGKEFFFFFSSVFCVFSGVELEETMFFFVRKPKQEDAVDFFFFF